MHPEEEDELDAALFLLWFKDKYGEEPMKLQATQVEAFAAEFRRSLREAP